MRVPLRAAVLILVGAAVAAALVPAGFGLDRRVTGELRRVSVEDLSRAPMILEDRNAANAEALTMHAMSVASAEGLVEAVLQDQMDRAEQLALAVAGIYGEEPVLISPDGEAILGPPPTPDGLELLRSGLSWTGFVFDSGTPKAIGLVALEGQGAGWSGAAGTMSAFDGGLANTLAGLARADVTVVGLDGSVAGTTLDSLFALELSEATESGSRGSADEVVGTFQVGDEEVWVAQAELAGAGTVLFSRTVSEELAALPGVRRAYAVAGLVTLLLALGVGATVTVLMLRPVRGLAIAADRLASGDFDAPVPSSRVDEVDRLGLAFLSMRDALQRRIGELGEANLALEERQGRLEGLQTELIRQDRLASSARMVAELAHEIRNPVANVRNCLEVVRRGLPDDSESSRFADMAIDELLRMHELAEQLLAWNRPTDSKVSACDAATTARQVAELARVGDRPVNVVVEVGHPSPALAAMPPDALKQVLFNLVQNAAEAGGEAVHVTIRVGQRNGTVRLDVLDDGPGILEEVIPQVFDPFFTTKGAVTGVGLGLFVAEGLVRRYGGRMEAANRTSQVGAQITVEVPAEMTSAE